MAASATLLVAMMFLGAAWAAPTAASPLVIHTAPFKGTLHVGRDLTSIGCGAKSSFLVAPSFSLKTGLGKVEEVASATGCGLPGFSDDASATGIAGFDSKIIPLATVKTDLFTTNFSFNFTYNLSATPMSPAGGPFAWAAVSAMSEAVLWNLTTMTPVLESFSLLPDSTNFSANGYENGTFGGSVLSTAPGTVPNLSDQYVVMMYFVVTIWVHAPADSKTHAAAKFDMATGAHKFAAVNWAWK